MLFHENLVLDQLIIPKLIFFFFLIIHRVNIALKGEILSWSLMGVKGLQYLHFNAMIFDDSVFFCLLFETNPYLIYFCSVNLS